MSKYTDTQRQDAVDLYVEHGATEAARRTGVSRRSVNEWAKAAGVTAQAKIEKTQQARDVLATTVAKDREELRLLLLEAARTLTRRAIATNKAREGQAWMTGAAIGIDKYRLEMGEATALVITGDMMDQAINDMRAELGDLDSD